MGFKLQLKATLENLTTLTTTDTTSSPFEYTFEIQCTSCREVHDKPITINQYEQHEISGSRGEANFVSKCKTCRKDCNISIERTKNQYTAEDSEDGKYVDLLVIEARGVDLVKFIPENGFFEAKGVKGTKFEEIDLSEGEFFDYDDDASQEISIQDIDWKISRS
ncbi:hypothetical protein WICPIJ_000923 [Wickerhamomyces pijperi]|uniref:DUF866-domain-containing protein n=1 Tax=Wickerhamomyces pijperi TaxID=599730 RepID=A0A9P8TR40_WICPI|nr:hypothetical protein WICPIJ_000923 [Wickerhamomyces pijperi]